MSLIRQINDPILHRSPKPVDFSALDWDLNAIYQIMNEQLIETGGVGIAANQCAQIENPPQMIIVGIPEANQEIIEKVQMRYPNQPVPRAKLMINPNITSFSEHTYFPESGEGCLSVAGCLRGKVMRHSEVTVSYFDLLGRQYTDSLTGFAAHIVQHECDHLYGVVYLQKILDELSREQLSRLQEVLKNVNHGRQIDAAVPHLIFARDIKGNVTIDFAALECDEILVNTDTLRGVIAQIDQRLANYK